MKPRKITIEILTSDPTNQDAIVGLLEACRWLQCHWGRNTATSEQSELTMIGKPLERIELRICTECGKYKPVNAVFCFGCAQLDAHLSSEVQELKRL